MPASLADALSFLNDRRRQSGTGYLARRTLEVFTTGGLTRLYQHLLHAADSARLERRYQRWMEEVEPVLLERERRRYRESPRAHDLSIDVIVPLYNTPHHMLWECIESVREQEHRTWRLILIDDASPDPGVSTIASEAAEADSRIEFHRLEENRGIGGATAAGVSLGSGECVAFLDHDDRLHPAALLCAARRFADDAGLDLLYSDEDKIDESGRRHNPAFKPGWSPVYLLTCNYVCHLAVYRREFLDRIGGVREGFDGAQDYDLVLRALSAAPRVAHAPLALYHWRTHPASTAGFRDAKPHAIEAGRRGLAEWCRRSGLEASVEDGPFKLTYRVRPTPGPGVHVHLVALGECTVADDARIAKVECVRSPEEAAARLLSLAAETSVSRVLWMNAGVEPVGSEWLDRLLEAAALPGVAMATPRVLDASGSVRSCGVVVEPVREGGAMIRPIYQGLPAHHPGYLWSMIQPRNVDAPDSACVLLNTGVLAPMARRLTEQALSGPGEVSAMLVHLAGLARAAGLQVAAVGESSVRCSAATEEVIRRIPAMGGAMRPPSLVNQNLAVIDPRYLGDEQDDF